MRSVLTGADYPRTLLSGVIGRLRVEGTPSDRLSDGRRAAIIRAVLMRNDKTPDKPKEWLMALDETSEDPAYVLGRLFGAFTYAERSYADRGATIRDKYMGGASATPGADFPCLMKGYEHNRAGLAKAGGQKVGAGYQGREGCRFDSGQAARWRRSARLPATGRSGPLLCRLLSPIVALLRQGGGCRRIADETTEDTEGAGA